MKKLIFMVLATAAMAVMNGCANKAEDSKVNTTDSIRYADSMKAVNATDSINAFNDSISRADSVAAVDSAVNKH